MGNAPSIAFVSDPLQFATTLELADLVDYAQKLDNNAYDYVIVGGGTAGCVLASRLSEDPDVRVLLIEAGQSHEQNLLGRIPMAASKMFQGPYDWNYETTPQDALNGRRVQWPRGKVLGGSSSLNFMVYHHCAPEDFDSWERLGAKGWRYENMRKYFARSANHTGLGSAAIAGVGLAPRNVPTAPIVHAFVAAAESLGVAATHDFNTSEGTLGTGTFSGLVSQSGERCSAATTYLTQNVLQRPNLTVTVSTIAQKVLFTQDADKVPKALGVQICTTENGPRFLAGARREVILSAGAIATPQLLMLSGIGPAKHLAEFNISVVNDLPQVGQHLRDHLMPGSLTFRAKPGQSWDSHVYHPFWSFIAFLRWRLFGTGPLATLLVPAGLFVRSDSPVIASDSDLPMEDTTSGPGAPDIEIACTPFAVPRGKVLPPAGSFGFSMGAAMLKPQSKGSIKLQSANVFDHPLIDANYLSTESDWNAAVRANRLILRLARTRPLSDWLDFGTPSPGSQENKTDAFWVWDRDPEKITDDEIREFIRAHGGTCWHPTSTARMGYSAEDSVLDSELRVHGVRGLRVVDASAFPEQVSGHPTAVIVAMAEKAADLIKGHNS